MAFGREGRKDIFPQHKTTFLTDLAIQAAIEFEKQNKENKNIDFDCPLLITNFPFRKEKEE